MLDITGFSTTFYEPVQTLLSDKFMGCFLVPTDGGAWNYNLIYAHSENMKYDVELGVPKEFYHEVHRPHHFINFASMESAESVATTKGIGTTVEEEENEIERENLFA
jgi:pre-mRNA-processing factor 8